MAKKGAKLYRVPARARFQVETAERVALRAAIQLGVTTLAANEHPTEPLGADGDIKITKNRDSQGMRSKSKSEKPLEGEKGAKSKPENRKTKKQHKRSALAESERRHKQGRRRQRTNQKGALKKKKKGVPKRE